MTNEYFYLIGRRYCFKETFNEMWLQDLFQKLRHLFFVTSIVESSTYLFIMEDRVEILIERVNSSMLQVKLGISKDLYDEVDDGLITVCGKKFHELLEQIEKHNPSVEMLVKVISLETMKLGIEDIKLYDLEDLKYRFSQGEDTVHVKDSSSNDDKLLDDSLQLLLTKQEIDVSSLF